MRGKRARKLEEQLQKGADKYNGKDIGVMFKRDDRKLVVPNAYLDNGVLQGLWWEVMVGDEVVGWVEGTEQAAIVRAQKTWPQYKGKMMLEVSDQTEDNKPLTRLVSERLVPHSSIRGSYEKVLAHGFNQH